MSESFEVTGQAWSDGVRDPSAPWPDDRTAVRPGTAPPARLTSEERVLGSARRYKAREVAKAAGVSTVTARRFWRSLGLPAVDSDQLAFTEADVTALRQVSEIVRSAQVDDEVAQLMTRAIGRSIDRMTSWQVQLLGETMADAAAQAALELELDQVPTATAVQRLEQAAPMIADAFAPLVLYAWRRHLASAMRRFVTDMAPDTTVPMLRRSVCFADLVSFTTLVRRLPERELSRLVQSFETVTTDLITSGGGRVIKTMGDEVLFVAWPPQVAAGIALRIADRIAADPLLPDVRVGMATGDVLARQGDVFGTTVNLASRITTLAQPGHVLCDDATAAALAQHEAIEATPLRRRAVKGLGQVLPWLLAWADGWVDVPDPWPRSRADD